MIFKIEVQQDAGTWQARITVQGKADWKIIERKGVVDSNGYPLPPEEEVPRWIASSVPLCQKEGTSARIDAQDLFLQGEPRPGKPDVEALGGYLFAVLLGDHWADIKQAAGLEAIRLQLSFPADPLWHHLPWELICNSEGPLAAVKNTVAITRLVQAVKTPGEVPAADPAEEVLSIEIPLRVLFVVGRELDSQLRPGAEYLNLLHRLQCTLGSDEEARGVALHTRLLMEATTQDVESAVGDFKPAVVHLISHGQISGKESVVLLTRYDTAARRNPKPDLVNAERLATLLRASNKDVRPHAVVLNACNTARIGDVQASFAGELVRRGIPLVVGMAGEVADAACRLFTRQFYTALVEQRPADIAAAEGRRAALLHFKNHTQNFDWARAVFCQAVGVETQFKQRPPQATLVRVAEDLRPKKKREPFCGRLQWLPLFRDLFQRRIPNLAIESQEEISEEEEDRPQIGKSRLLDELAWQSVLEGWIPIRIDQVRTRYSNFMHFATHLFAILENTREKFDVERANRSEVVRKACEAFGVEYKAGDQDAFMSARDKVLTLLEPQQKIAVTHDTIRQMLQRDLEALRKDIETVTGARKGVLILWDQLDYEEALEEDLVGLLDPHGLGSKANPAPVVFTYAKRSTGGKKLLTAIDKNQHVAVRNLQRYDTFENGMACRQFLAWKKYVPARAQRQLFEKMMATFEGTVDGYPSKLFAFEQGIAVLTSGEIIVQFDDVLIMNQYSGKS
jgi:hypothetical protein